MLPERDADPSEPEGEQDPDERGADLAGCGREEFRHEEHEEEAGRGRDEEDGRGARQDTRLVGGETSQKQTNCQGYTQDEDDRVLAGCLLDGRVEKRSRRDQDNEQEACCEKNVRNQTESACSIRLSDVHAGQRQQEERRRGQKQCCDPGGEIGWFTTGRNEITTRTFRQPTSQPPTKPSSTDGRTLGIPNTFIFGFKDPAPAPAPSPTGPSPDEPAGTDGGDRDDSPIVDFGMGSAPQRRVTP